MDLNSNAILTLCSHLCVGNNVKPFESKEWSDLAIKLMNAELQPADIFNISRQEFREKLFISDDYIDRIFRLIERNASLSVELSQIENMGINVVTRADKGYPYKLKKILGNNCPPLFYIAGDLSLLNREFIGYVGSRTISDDDIKFTKKTVAKTIAHNFGVISGGAKGVDSVSTQQAIEIGAPVVEYISDSMIKKIKNGAITKAIRDKRMILLSVTKPDAGFNVGMAMMRNKYIYAQSSGTIVVKAEKNKGGTWSGAVENLRHQWCKELCWNNNYSGNKALIEKGAIPIDEKWDGDINSIKFTEKKLENEQLSLFDLLGDI